MVSLEENQISIFSSNAKLKQLLANEPMASHTTFRIGGPADYFVMPETVEELAEVLKLCKEKSMPYFILGNGSNLLVGDKGYRGVIIQIYKEMNHIRIEDDKVFAQAGALLSRVGTATLEAELTGFEFAAGIPGTVVTAGSLFLSSCKRFSLLSFCSFLPARTITVFRLH